MSLLLAFGCASEHHTVAVQTQAPQEDAFAPALAFDPPVTLDQEPLALDRESRRPSAFVGYDDAITTYSYLRVDDRMANDNQGRYERRAISERFAVTTR